MYVIKSVCNWKKKMKCITADKYKDATQIHNHVTSSWKYLIAKMAAASVESLHQ